MTSQSSSTNNSRLSLENSITNIFALTDLSGLRWRRLRSAPVPNTDVLEDPVLKSYTRCLNQAELLCAWARVPVSDGSAQPNSFMDFAKELWVFWYGEEPSILQSHISPDLTDFESGSWENTMLSYECRTFLFKALHNVIERSLISKGFVRIGKWFVQPHAENSSANTGSQLSFSFENFFLHGESTVCVSVEVERKPPIHKITSHHLKLARGSAQQTTNTNQHNHNQPNQQSSESQPPVYTSVILSPFGMSGKLTGGTVLPTDDRSISEWQQFYPIPNSVSNDLPPIVEVAVGGVKMKFPSAFVLTTENIPKPKPTQHSGDRAERTIPLICSKTATDSLQNNKDKTTDEPATWNLTDIHNRTNCVCTKQKSRGNRSKNNPTSQLSPPKPDLTSSRGFRNPFHRLSPPPDKLLSRGNAPNNVNNLSHQNNNNQTQNSVPASPFNRGQPPSNSQTVTEPKSIPAPSPRINSPRVNSPRPSPRVTYESPSSVKPPRTPASVPSHAIQTPKPQPGVPTTPGHSNAQTPGAPSSQTVKQEMTSPSPTRPPEHKQLSSPVIREIGKRPRLPSSVEDSGELQTDALYTFNSLRTWLELPLKKFKSELDDAFIEEDIYNVEVTPIGYESIQHPLTIDCNTLPPIAPKLTNHTMKNENADKNTNANNQLTVSPHSLKTEAALAPKQSDLDNIFDTDGEGDDSHINNNIQHSVTTAAHKTTVGPPGSSLASAHCVGPISAADLSQIFPTPPSNQNTALSPDHAVCSNVHYNNIEQENTTSHHLIQTNIQAKYLPVEEFEPIDLPSKHDPVILPDDCVYRSHLYDMPWNRRPILDQPFIPLTSVENLPVPILEPTSVRSVMSPPFGTPLGIYSPASITSLPPKSVTGLSVENPSTGGHGVSSVFNTSSLPDANSLLVTMALTDSMLNMYKDTNFDSCNLCVCNNNILGNDLGLYLQREKYEPQYKCTCGFSAVTNRSFSFCSGLFYEDECEVMNFRDERFDRVKLKPTAEKGANQLNKTLIDELMSHYSTSLSLLSRHVKLTEKTISSHTNRFKIQLTDVCHVLIQALNTGQFLQSPHDLDKQSCNIDEYWSKWSLQLFSHTNTVPDNEIVLLLKSLQPTLASAVQQMRLAKLFPGPAALKVADGPLSWSSFFKLAGRDSDELLKPQPVPRLLVSADEDRMMCSPFAIQHWDKLGLKPYCGERNVSYVVILPENEVIMESAKKFFQELSLMYESCHLGKHVPYQSLKDGQMKVKKSYANLFQDKNLPEFFNKQPGSESVTAKLKLLAKVCRYQLAPMLAQNEPDITPPGPVAETFTRPQSQTANTSSLGVFSPPQNTETSSVAATTRDILTDTRYKDAKPRTVDNENTSLVIYMINPFNPNNSSNNKNDDESITLTSLIHTYRALYDHLPSSLQSRTQLQIVPQHFIINSAHSVDQQTLKSEAFSVFTRISHQFKYQNKGLTMTGFGPVADRKKCRVVPTPSYSMPPFILSTPDNQINPDIGKSDSKVKVLFCSYCLSEDQRYLLASVVLDNGELLDTTMINIHVPAHSRRKKATVLRHGITQLWNYLTTCMCKTLYSWRLVIGRFGRLGHGELKEWAAILSKRNMLKTSKIIKDCCDMCGTLPQDKQPCNLIGACVVSIEPHASISILNTETLNREEKKSTVSFLTTPKDASVTHILVIPNSTTAGGNRSRSENNLITSDTNDLLLGFPSDDLVEGVEEWTGVQELFGVDALDGSPPMVGSPTNQNLLSAAGIASRRNTVSSQMDFGEADQVNLLQQPLSMGYMLSTAPTGKLPNWFYTTVPKPDTNSPTVLKSALHYHIVSGSAGVDDMNATNSLTSHPLDSTRTCDVLRFVLDSYNRLSWLTFDPVTNDRTSCLPVHMNTLMKLYHTLNTFATQ